MFQIVSSNVKISLTVDSTRQVDHHQPALHHVPDYCVASPLQELSVLVDKDSK